MSKVYGDRLTATTWEGLMIQHPAARLMALVREQQSMSLDELLVHFPELTRNQVLSLVDALSRYELIRLQRRGFQYKLLPPL